MANKNKTTATAFLTSIALCASFALSPLSVLAAENDESAMEDWLISSVSEAANSEGADDLNRNDLSDAEDQDNDTEDLLEADEEEPLPEDVSSLVVTSTDALPEQDNMLGISAMAAVSNDLGTISQIFPDENLAKAIATGLNMKLTDKLTIAKAEGVRYFPTNALVSKNISNLAGIGVFKNLTRLEVNNNPISSLPSDFTQLTSLSVLSLQNCTLGSFPQELTTMNSLTELNLVNNGISSLPDAIENLASLRALYLRNNNLKTLPNTMRTLTSLQTLHLDNNPLGSLPYWIGSLTSLSSLDAPGTGLTSIPDSIGNLINLNFLHLENNNISSLPSSMINMTNLRSLYLNNNVFTEVPNFINQMPEKYSYINLTNNKLTAIPEVRSSIVLYINGNNISSLPEDRLNGNNSYYSNQQFTQQIATSGYVNETFTFSPVSIVTKSQVAGSKVSFTYSLLSPSGATVDVSKDDVLLENNLLTILSTSLLESEGEYVFVATDVANNLVYNHVFRLTVKQGTPKEPDKGETVNPDDIVKEPEKNPILPDTTPVVPEKNPVLPDTTPVIPEKNPVLPDATPVELEKNPVLQDTTPVAPQENPVVPAAFQGAAATAANIFINEAVDNATNRNTERAAIGAQETTPLEEETVANSPNTVSLEDDETPLFGQADGSGWSLLSLLLMMGSVLVSFVSTVLVLIDHKKENKTNTAALRFGTIFLGLVSLVAFFLLYSMDGQMVVVDIKTTVFLVILLSGVGAIFLDKTRTHPQNQAN